MWPRKFEIRFIDLVGIEVDLEAFSLVDDALHKGFIIDFQMNFCVFL